MGKIFCLMGKSASGKDTIYKRLLEQADFPFSVIVPCTTRPMRQGETPGVEYFFYTEEALQELIAAGKIIELRRYHTVHGVWSYFTADDGRIDLERESYLIIGTLESYLNMQDYFGREKLVPLYLSLDDGVRLQRALDRERAQKEPKYAELCRRFLADEQDFSEQNLEKAKIRKVFRNETLSETTQEILTYMKRQLSIRHNH